MPTLLNQMKMGAHVLLQVSTRSVVVRMQISHLIDEATSGGELMELLPLIAEFEIEEEFARQEVILNELLAA